MYFGLSTVFAVYNYCALQWGLPKRSVLFKVSELATVQTSKEILKWSRVLVHVVLLNVYVAKVLPVYKRS